ncbi:hypothetical protein [Red seabream iridovirus]|nr:hypothetical protein [Red seabream iridovirus]
MLGNFKCNRMILLLMSDTLNSARHRSLYSFETPAATMALSSTVANNSLMSCRVNAMVLMSVLSKCVVILRKLNGMVISSSLSKNASVGVYSLLYGGSITLLNTSPPPHPRPLPAAQSAARRLTIPM